MSIQGLLARGALGALFMLATPMPARAIAVSATTPTGNANHASRSTAVAITFDGPLDTSTITSSTFRIWGTQSGSAAGTTAYSNGNATLTFTPSHTFFPGEWVSIQLSHAIKGADATSLRAAGYAFQFQTATGPGALTFTQNGPSVSVRSSPGNPTRLYGGAITDINHDGWVDFIAVNEVSADLRVLLNTADGSGLLGPVLTPPEPIGVEASPSVVADFNNDGFMDVATANATSNTISIALGSGDGHFISVQNLDAPARPHGIVAIDVDGDADLDIVVASENGERLTLYTNNGQGVFGNRFDFANDDSDAKYGLGAGDMNGDGILDLVAGTAWGPTHPGHMLVFTGNGDGTFTETENIDAGGYSWKLVLGDVNNDGKLDVAQANGDSNNAAILLGNGDGTLQPAQIYSLNGTGVGSSLGDLDGDGDLDWVISSYTASTWYIMRNDGDGTFTRVGTIDAPMNASCASLYDFDNDGTLDMALADEVSDEILLMKNDGSTSVQHADATIALAADPQAYTPGASLTYTITIGNAGPDAAAGVTVDDAFPAALSGIEWACVASGGASCPASGSGDIGESVTIPSGGSVVFTATGTVAAGATGPIENRATATVDAPTVDPNAANNTATIQTMPAALPDAIFASGFDPG
jgi:uncharacterized repeat protein (TIGR01451 family)